MLLKFGNDGKFKIMIVGDIHEKYEGGDKTDDYLRMMNKMAEELKPDVAIIMGDLITQWVYDETGEREHATKEPIVLQIKRITDPLTSHGIPFALVFGNHDGEGDGVFPKEDLLEWFRDIPGFLITDDIEVKDISGCGNCNLPIMSSDGTKKAFNLWLFDSHNRDSDGISYDYVKQDQIAWYERTAEELKKENGGIPLPSIVFQHIPVIEEYELLKKTCILHPCQLKGHGIMSKSRYVIDKKKATGYMGEAPCTPDYNSGQFESWKNQGDVIAAFFGHDHMNDFIGEVDGITLGQCKATGFHIYGDGLRQGVRMVTLDEKNPRSFDTKMHRYRDYFGTDCKSIKGVALIPDRWHDIARRSRNIALCAAGAAAVTVATVKLIKYKKK